MVIDERNMRGVRDLFNAIVYQAVKDYRLALVNAHKCRFLKKKDPKRKSAEAELRELERFFRNDACAFTKYDGVKLMQEVKNEVIEYDYDLKELYKSHHPEKKDKKKKGE